MLFAQIVLFAGCAVIAGATLIVKLAELDVAAGEHVPLAKHRNKYPLIPAVALVIVKIDEVAPE